MFGWAPSSLREALAEDVNFVGERLTSTIAAWASDTELSAPLAAGRKSVFGVDDHIVTVGVGKGRKSVRFSAKDWREIRRVGSAIDDAELDQLHALESDEPAGGLAGFAGRAHIGVPDWAAAARGYCFRRDATDSLADAVVEYLSSPKRSLLDPTGGGQMRRPLFLSGPPAIGKSVGLLRVAWELRRTHRLFVLWLLPGLSGLDPVQVERICRMVETRGLPWTVLVVDGAPPEECMRLLDKMLSDGRRVILLGSETAFVEENEPAHGYRRFPIDMTLSPREASEWSGFLAKHRLQDPGAGGRDFLSRLSAVLPEVRYDSTAALLQEYERVIRAAEPVGTQTTADEGLLAQQFRELFPELVRDPSIERPAGRFGGDPFVRDLVELILFYARADLPVATDTLFVLLGSDLLNSFDRLQEAFGGTALIPEVELDNEGTIGLTTAHRLHAQWLLRAIRPTAAAQLDVLRTLVERVPWDLDAYPGHNPTQDYVIRILRQVGPRGGAASDYGSVAALRALADILATIRVRHGKRHPGLLSLEAIIRGDIAKQDEKAEADEKRRQCKVALELLGRHPPQHHRFLGPCVTVRVARERRDNPYLSERFSVVSVGVHERVSSGSKRYRSRNSTAATPTPSVRWSLVSGICVSLASRIWRLGGVSRQLSNTNDSAQRLLMVSSNSTQPSASMRSHFGCPVITTSTASAAGGASGSMGTLIRASPVVQRNARSSVYSSPWKPGGRGAQQRTHRVKDQIEGARFAIADIGHDPIQWTVSLS